jgi:hypothetical protein
MINKISFCDPLSAQILLFSCSAIGGLIFWFAFENAIKIYEKRLNSNLLPFFMTIGGLFIFVKITAMPKAAIYSACNWNYENGNGFEIWNRFSLITISIFGISVFLPMIQGHRRRGKFYLFLKKLGKPRTKNDTQGDATKQ